jgi:FkbM family methyltransferase
MRLKIKKPLYHHIMHFLSDMTYVDIGARAMKANKFVETFPFAQYIGFELDVDECKRLNALGIARHRFYAQALDSNNGRRTLYITRNPACSSLYEPNSQEMHRFTECGPYFDVLKKKTIQTVSLDDWCRDNHLAAAEFLELDTQGSELDILRGSEYLLATSILGLKVEVEFFQMYKDQPLFSDIDTYLRRWDFCLFDLSRYRLRRAYIKTRGQLLWGHAFYLKNVHQMKDPQPKKFLSLAAIASYYGFEDYALDVLTAMIGEESDFESFKHKEKIQSIFDSYADSFSQPIRKGIQRLRKRDSAWKVTSRKDHGYFIKD